MAKLIRVLLSDDAIIGALTVAETSEGLYQTSKVNPVFPTALIAFTILLSVEALRWVKLLKKASLKKIPFREPGKKVMFGFDPPLKIMRSIFGAVP